MPGNAGMKTAGMTTTHAPKTTPLWLPEKPLLLASTSATRRSLIESAGVPVEVRRPNVDEREAEMAMSGNRIGARGIAQQLARAKALAVSALEPERLVVGGDQTLACGDILFHKPAGLAQALQQLQQLSGRTHQLYSAFALARHGRIVHEMVDTAHLTMRVLGEAFLTRYLAQVGEEVMNSVGGYQLEGAGASLFETISGDYFTILGLPLLPLLAALRAESALAA